MFKDTSNEISYGLVFLKIRVIEDNVNTNFYNKNYF